MIALLGLSFFTFAEEPERKFVTFPVDRNLENSSTSISSSPFTVDVFIQGLEYPVSAYLDTGTSFTFISENLSSKLGLSLYEEVIAATQLGPNHLPLFLSKDRISIGLRNDARAISFQPLVLKQDDLETYAQPGIADIFNIVDLVIGIDYLNHTKLEISPTEPRLSLSVENYNPKVVDVQSWNLAVTIKNEEYSCKLDSAAEQQDGVTFLSTFKSYDVLKDKFRTISWSYNSLSYHSWAHTAFDPEAKISGLQGAGLLVHFEPQDHDSPEPAKNSQPGQTYCLIGLKALDLANVNYADGKLEIRGKHASARYNRSGFKEALYSPESQLLWVQKVWPNSDAYKKGLTENFIVTAINGIRLTPDKVASAQELFYAPTGTEIEITWYEGPDEAGEFSSGSEPATTVIELSEVLE